VEARAEKFCGELLALGTAKIRDLRLRDAARYADCMTGARIPRVAFCQVWAAFILATSISTLPARAQTVDRVTITPTAVVAGSPELICVHLRAAATLDGEWLNQKLEFFRGRDGKAWYALAGVDVKAQTGPSTLEISARMASGAPLDLSRGVEILPAHYRTETLTVAPGFVAPGPDELARIKAEVQLKSKVFAASAAEPLWSGDFHAPVHSPPTDSFGTRRTFNGELASVHEGMDFRAATGTPVHAGNSGVVVLARPLYYEGNCVVIDHGLGLFTISMHLSRIDVGEGDRVAAGQLIGLSGATGRVTGPHLHWAVRWQNAYLDPAKMLRMDLTKVH
jgi:murein DD-endopeptidase MepM/ murein hydrolase activator NlpD